MERDKLLKLVLWKLVNKKEEFENDTDKDYVTYIKELITNDNFLIKEYFNEIDLPKSDPFEWFLSMINEERITIRDILDFFCSLAMCERQVILNFIFDLERIWNE